MLSASPKAVYYMDGFTWEENKKKITDPTMKASVETVSAAVSNMNTVQIRESVKGQTVSFWCGGLIRKQASPVMQTSDVFILPVDFFRSSWTARHYDAVRLLDETVPVVKNAVCKYLDGVCESILKDDKRSKIIMSEVERRFWEGMEPFSGEILSACKSGADLRFLKEEAVAAGLNILDVYETGADKSLPSRVLAEEYLKKGIGGLDFGV